MFLHLKTNRQVITPTTKAYQPYMLTNVGNKKHLYTIFCSMYFKVSV